MTTLVSGLGRLFNPTSSSLAPHTSRGQRQLESVTEEAHTYDLLYPEAGSLQHAQHHAFPLRHGDPSSIAAAANSSDDRGGLNIQHPRDIRIIIGQNIGGSPRVLFDSQPPILPATSRSRGATLERREDERPTGELRRQGSSQKSRTAPHSRQSSINQTAQSIFESPGLPLSPVNEGGGLFGTSRRPNTSDGEGFQAQLAKEERQETEAMLSSMFGATGHRIAAGTKIHIKPYTPDPPESARPLSPDTSRPGPQRRRTPLTRSTTTDDLHNLMSALGSGSSTQHASRRQTSSILVTKIFYVDSADEGPKVAVGDEDIGLATDPNMDGHAVSVKRPTSSDDLQSKKFRTPAFAIAVVIYMPLNHQHVKMPLSARASPALGQAPAYFNQQPEAAQYFSSEELDHNVEYVMAHWDMITRALSSLEVVAQCQISNALSQLDVDIPAPPMNAPSVGTNHRSRRGPPLPALQLPGGALQHSTVIHKAVDAAGRRVVTALQIRGVAVGQGRWGVWREEARGVGKWAGGREQNFFLFNLLTAFLGNHTEWLDLMSSRLRKQRYGRGRYHSQQQYGVVRHRTVVVSLDKMAARRLVFLLSAFLQPSSTGSKRNEASKSDASTSVPASSTSPLLGSSPMSRRQSLRRTLNRSQRGYGWQSSDESENAIAGMDNVTEVSDDRTITESPLLRQQGRRDSDVVSIRSVALPITAAGPRFRKSSTTTTAAVLPESAIPVAHFSNYTPETRLGTSAERRPGSSGSIASLSLQRTLSRSESQEHSGTSADSQSTGRWFWHSRRGSSAETSETPISSAEGLGIFVPPKDRRPVNKLAVMVEDANIMAGSQGTLRVRGEAGSDSQFPKSKLGASDGSSPPKNIPREPDVLEPFPLDLSVNESDGVIDIKLPPLDSQASSYGSITSSPRGLRKMASGSLPDASRPQSPVSIMPLEPQPRRSHAVSEVGGWLKRFHQDLALQALQPYDTLKEEIKQAMRIEPAPTTFPNQDHHDIADEWIEVCTTLIADVTTFTLTRLTLRRKYAFSSHHQADALFGLNTNDNPEEDFIEESLIDHDATLTVAVEKVLSHSGQSSFNTSRAPSRVPSRAASRAPSPPRSRSNSKLGDEAPVLEVPKSECKKMVLGALEQVAKSVRDEMSTPTKGKAESDVKDSTLKEGVRRWFEEVRATDR